MVSNERLLPFRPRPTWQSEYQPPPRPSANEATLKSEQVQIERKAFVFLLKENPRGRLLRIVGESGRNSPSIIIPATELKASQKLLAEMVQTSNELPPKKVRRSQFPLTQIIFVANGFPKNGEW